MKLAVVTSRFPYPLEKGDKLRVYHQIRLLSQQHEIILIALSEKAVQEIDKTELKKYCEKIYVLRLKKWKVLLSLLASFFNRFPLQVAYFFDRQLQQQAETILLNEKPDHIFAQLIRTVPYVENVNIPKTLDYMDAFSAITTRWSQKVPWPFSSFWKNQAEKIKRFDHSVYKSFVQHLIISEPDRDLMGFGNTQPIKVVRNGVDFDYFKPNPEAEKTFEIAFVGNMGYLPNVEAARFLVKEVLPIIHRDKPNVKVLLAGARPAREVKHLAGSHVEVTGWVKDIRDAYNSAEIFVAPLFLGAGMQNKILEAMCMRLPCVTTNRVNNAIKAPDNSVLKVANSAEDFAAAVIELLENRETMALLSENAYNFALENFSWEATVNQIDITRKNYEEQV
ncbi:MAG: glycosyltransferase [Bacteroidota bacterium]